MLVLGRYALGEEIARGGIASVHLGLVLGDAGFSRPVAIKRLLPSVSGDPDLAAAFLDEARLASRVRHPNVVSTLDVSRQGDELFLVLEYVHGESLSGLIQAASVAGERLPQDVVSAVVAGVLRGLHAAHEARDEVGTPLGIVHRDVTPHNVLVGVDGVARVIDFGIAKAASRGQVTREGQVKGKLRYLAPEQLRQNAERATDVYGAGVCLWEALTGERAFDGDNESAVLAKVMAGAIGKPSRYAPDVSPALDDVVTRALAKDPAKRFASAEAMATALEAIVPPAPATRVGACVERLAAARLGERTGRIAALVGARDEIGAEPASTSATSDSAPDRNVPADASLLPDDTTTVVAARSDLVPPPRRRWIAAATALVALGAAGAIALARSTSRDAGDGFAPTAVSAAATPTPGATPPSSAEANRSRPEVADPAGAAKPDSPAPAVATTDDAVAAPLDAPAETSQRGDSRAPANAPPPRRAAQRRPAPRTAPGAAAKPGCDPPYAIDADGVRRYKKACLD